MILHPRPNDAGQPVTILKPHEPSPLAAWGDPSEVAIALPGGVVPAVINGIALAPWTGAPADDAGWEAIAAASPIAEPPFACPAEVQAAAGVVVVEPDRRIWLAAPSNGFGGVPHVVPKGRVDAGGSLAGTAIREAWEEVGLVAHLTGHLIDLQRSTTFVRYYIGRRVGGSPADAGWESQASLLCPISRLDELLTGPFDAALVAAIRAHLG